VEGREEEITSKLFLLISSLGQWVGSIIKDVLGLFWIGAVNEAHVCMNIH
jgi:hypothetical protein